MCPGDNIISQSAVLSMNFPSGEPFQRPRPPRYTKHIHPISTNWKTREKYLLQKNLEIREVFERTLDDNAAEHRRQIQQKDDETKKRLHELERMLQKKSQENEEETQIALQLVRRVELLQRSFKVTRNENRNTQQTITSHCSSLENIDNSLHEAVMQQESLRSELLAALKEKEAAVKELGQRLESNKRISEKYRLTSQLLTTENSKLAAEKRDLTLEVSQLKSVLSERARETKELQRLVENFQVDSETNPTHNCVLDSEAFQKLLEPSPDSLFIELQRSSRRDHWPKMFGRLRQSSAKMAWWHLIILCLSIGLAITLCQQKSHIVDSCDHLAAGNGWGALELPLEQRK
ncbi:hypothetical protein PTTG_29164 [Puccinia triticina 1-1 BBBD Race 1]|uniref:Spindle assembly checkpoint component MAD1 n=1 Tax=Puccinia triticina (isolate 1-1 / race 1 (BBBD)) TaxID=630390 RepID=A0A180G5Y4_PUCT1|nr:hypothetical protein PTTG_29164 [Puccinia triticina 1-1 BBBD Race 1]